MQGYNTAGTIYPLTLTLDNVQFDGATANDFAAPSQTNNAQFTFGPGPVNIAGFLIADAAVTSNNITVTNSVSNSNTPLDCSTAFVYLAGDLAAPNGAIVTGSSPKITAVVQNVVAPLVSGATTTPQQKAPTGTVNLLENGVTVGSGTLTGRLASITVSNITAGTHIYTAKYLGDGNYPAGLTFGSLTVTASSGVTPPVANNQNVSVAYNTGTPITLTATGTGTLTYSIVAQPTHGALSGTAPNVTYTPTAGYSGADSFTFKANNGVDSNVATVSLTVQIPATTLVLSTPSPSSGLTTNQTTTLTATLSPTSAGGNTATGTISFSDGGTVICNGVSFNSATGVSTCVTPALTNGTHNFTAAYTGDAHFAPSTSGTQSVSVSVALSSISVTGFPAADHIGVLHSVTVTAKDGTGNPINGYTGTVTLTSSDPSATLPVPYTFLGSENGVHTFSVTLNTGGTQTITASVGAINGSETGIVVDDFVWVLNPNGTLDKLSEAPAEVTGAVGLGGANSSKGGLAFDSLGNVWSVTSGNNTLNFGSKTGTSPASFTGGGLNAPVSVAVDGAGYIWVANSGNNSISEFLNSGTAVSGTAGYGASALSSPSSISIDGTGGHLDHEQDGQLCHAHLRCSDAGRHAAELRSRERQSGGDAMSHSSHLRPFMHQATERNTTSNTGFARTLPMRLFQIASVLTLSAAAVVLSGCSGFVAATPSGPASVAGVGFKGSVYGGQQPIVNSNVQLWQAGTTGYGLGATALTANGVFTDANGSFSFNSTPYSCTAGSMVYATASGGQPTTNVTNTSAVLITGLGLCGNLTSSTFISINEITTVATVWSLTPFMKGINIGAPATNQAGLVSAFADINTLANTATGQPGISAANITIPTAEINTLANSIAGCINTSGVGSPGCNQFFGAAPNPDNSSPTDTVTAALNIARNPSRNVAAIIAAQGNTPPFAPTIASANDLTIAVTYSGSGINNPAAAAVDASGNLWIANTTGNSVTELSHAGSVLSGASGFTAGAITAPSALALDPSGNVWIANGNSTLTELSQAGTNVGTSPFTGGGLSTPTSIAFDGLGNVWLSNSGNGSVSEFSSTGTAITGSGGLTAPGITAPIGIALNPR